MDQNERMLLRNTILTMIKEAEKDIQSMEAMTEPVKPDVSLGRISRMDAINNKSVQEAALRTKRRQHSQLRLALTRLNNEDFGTCSRCKRPIQQKRLILLPEKTTCVHCSR